MQRPNLAARPFLDSRPVIVTGVALAVVAVALTVLSVANYMSERGQATQLAAAGRDFDVLFAPSENTSLASAPCRSSTLRTSSS